MWLDEIEEDDKMMLSLAKTDTNDWVQNNYGKRARMARVLREQTYILSQLSDKDIDAIRGIDPNFPPASQLRAYAQAYKDMSDDAKELLHDNKDYQAGGK